jgi:hypothetical protein
VCYMLHPLLHLDKDYKLWSSSLCIFIQPPSPNIPRHVFSNHTQSAIFP